jgi:hypothetical protein
MEESDDELRKEVEKIYTPLSVAKEEIWRRWNDKALRKKVEDFLGGNLPEFLKEEPRAYLARNITSPNFELKYFIDLTREIGLESAFIEHANDKFVAKNSDKYHLARMHFHNGNGRKNGDKISALNIIDFNKCQGEKICKMKTIWGENFINFHHRILKNNYPDSFKSIIDISKIAFLKNKKMTDCYDKYLALFIYSGVLFENFLLKKGPGDLTTTIVIPAVLKLEKVFGIKPLIVPLSPIDEQANLYWWCYSEKIRSFCEK